MSNKMFRRCFVPHYNFRFSSEPLKELADNLVYVCESPIFDDQFGDEFKVKFEGKINKEMLDFDPEKDIIAFYGDAMIFAMMIAKAIEYWDSIWVARFSSKLNKYLVRKISTCDFNSN